MLKKPLHISLLAIAILFIAGNNCTADSAPREVIKDGNRNATPNEATTKFYKKKQTATKLQVKNKEEDEAPVSVQNENEKQEYQASVLLDEDNRDDHLACTVTPFIDPKFTTSKPINKGNNLTRRPGYTERAKGDYIRVSGVVVDENCLPIQGVVVEIWQTDSSGHYEWEYETGSYWALPPSGKDNNFLYSGSAHTDNMGLFEFITIMPSARTDGAPYINITAKRQGYEKLQSRIYFTGQPLNDSDSDFSGLTEEGKERLTVKGNGGSDNAGRGISYYFPITLGGISPYKRF